MIFPEKIHCTSDGCELTLVNEILKVGKEKPKERIATYRYTFLVQRHPTTKSKKWGMTVELELKYIVKMLEFTHLRIGNYVEHDDEMWEVTGLGDSEVSLFRYRDGNHWSVEYEYVYPIQLTGELFERMGFLHVNTSEAGCYVHNKEMTVFANDSFATFRFAFVTSPLKASVSLGDSKHGSIFTVVQWLHELQNIWFFNTKEELKYNSPVK